MVSSELSNPFVVEVRDQNGDDYQGATVTFAVTAGGGTLSSTSVTTGSGGRASSTLTLGSTAGTNTVTATVSGIIPFVTFTATATAEALVATTFVRISGNAQTGTVGKELDNPFVAEVQDQNGDGLSGITVSFAVTIGGGTVSATSVTTNSNGQASTTLTLGSAAGSNRVVASASGITQTRNFNATGQATVATTVVEVSGDSQAGDTDAALPHPFIVEVRDQDGDALSGATVAFAVTAGGGTLSVTSVTTNASGRAQTTLTLGSTAGTNTVTATVSGITAITFTATAAVVLTISVSVPATADPGETVDISATAVAEDTIEWTTTGGSIADTSAADTELTVPSESGVVAVTGIATDADGATVSDTAYITVGVELLRVNTPAYQIEIEGVDVTDRWIRRDGLNIQTALDYPRSQVFRSGQVTFNLDNADSTFDASEPSNFFVDNGLPAHGRGATVFIRLGESASDLVAVFAGKVSVVTTSLQSTKARFQAHDLSIRLNRDEIEDFGDTLTRTITDFEDAAFDYDELNPVFYFPIWGTPIALGSVSLTVDDTSVNIVDSVATTGVLSNTNAEIDYGRGLIRFEAPPDDGADTVITATWKRDYRYKRPDFLARQLLKNSGLQTEIGIADDTDARFGIEQALLRHPTDAVF